MALTLYTNPMSRGRIARWMLEEVGVPYEVKILAYGPDMKGAAYRAINPMGKVPALVHDGHVVTECAAICAYLADAFPKAGLAPSPAERADYYRFLFFTAGPLEAALTNHNAGFDPAADRQAMFGYGSFGLTIDAFETMLTGRDFITGRFSAADVYVGAQVGWGMQFGTLPKRPAFEAYAARVQARPAFARSMKLDDEAAAKAQ